MMYTTSAPSTLECLLAVYFDCVNYLFWMLIDYSALHPHWALPIRVLWSVWFKRLVSPTAFCCLVYTLSNFVSTWSYRLITSFIFDGPITCYCRDFVYIRVTGAQLKPTLLRINWDRTVFDYATISEQLETNLETTRGIFKLYALWYNSPNVSVRKFHLHTKPFSTISYDNSVQFITPFASWIASLPLTVDCFNVDMLYICTMHHHQVLISGHIRLD